MPGKCMHVNINYLKLISNFIIPLAGFFRHKNSGLAVNVQVFLVQVEGFNPQ